MSVGLALGLLACGPQTSVSEPPVDTGVAPTPTPGPPEVLQIEMRAAGVDAWGPLDMATLRAQGATVQLASTDPRLFEAITEVVWLLDKDVTRDLDGPPWSPHPEGVLWRLDAGSYRLCAQAWTDEGLVDTCASFVAEGSGVDELPLPPAVADADRVAVPPEGLVVAGSCDDCGACTEDVWLDFDEVVTGPIVVRGVRHVVAEAGSLQPGPTDTPTHGLWVQQACGIVHLEGLEVIGGNVLDGIRVEAPDAEVRVLASRVDVRGSLDALTDPVQVTASASTLVQQVSLRTATEGLDLAGAKGDELGLVTLWDVDVVNDLAAMVLRVQGASEVSASGVWLQTPVGCDAAVDVADPTDPAWDVLQCSAPPGGDVVPLGASGLTYVRQP